MQLGPLEEKVMETIWQEGGKTTVRDVWEKNFSKDYAYTTILTIFQKLERKGLIKGELRGKVKFYVPLISRDDYYKKKVEEVLTEVLNKNPNAAYLFFLENTNLSEEDVKEILRILRGKEE
ncbi:MAG: BlaI/MecI/CopY family transcriptional regulator [candidate division WOR-3 bacterium]